MFQTNLNSEKHDILITSNLKPNQLPSFLERALSVAPEGETRDMLLLSVLTNCAYALPAMRMLHGRPHHTYSSELLTMIVAPAASGKGMPVIMKRIGMILTGLRLDMNKPLPERVVCSDEDFQTMLLVGHKLLMHAAMVFQMMPELKATPVGEIGGKMLQKQFFQMLSTDFSKQDAVKQAEVLGVSVKTMNNWLTKYTQSNDILHIAHGLYRKKSLCSA